MRRPAQDIRKAIKEIEAHGSDTRRILSECIQAACGARPCIGPWMRMWFLGRLTRFLPRLSSFGRNRRAGNGKVVCKIEGLPAT